MSIFDQHVEYYSAMLNEYADFDYDNDVDSWIEFQNNNDKELIDLERTFYIKKIAIGETDFDRIISLMKYIHNELFFVGTNVSPSENNTYEIMKIKKTGSLFCSYQATVLLEMLLSIGIKAIKVSCLPKEFDGDCHVVIISYLKDINKWVFFDPTFNTYFSDKDGNPLSLIEIRECYQRLQVDFKHIEINKQWELVMNGIVCDSYDEWYKIYMAKNMFRFMFPNKSTFNFPSKTDSEFIFLNPLGYDSKNEYDKISNAIHNKYTHNASIITN